MIATLILLPVLAAFAAAQSSTVSQSMPATATAGFNPAAVDSSLRFAWCHAQLNSCPQICGGQVTTNSCDQTGLTYQCVCLNGTTPDCSAYMLTLPFYICEATYAQCITNHPNDAEGQQTCTDNEKCGTLNATAADLAASSAAAAASATSSSASSSSASATSSAASSASASATHKSDALASSQRLATGAFAAVLMAAFKLLL